MPPEIDTAITRFIQDSAWNEAVWNATTFRWHPTSEAPPIMGIVFHNAIIGKGIFKRLIDETSNSDRFEELRVSIIEDNASGGQSGYSVNLCPEPESLAVHATMDEVVLDPDLLFLISRWNRMFPIPGSPLLLPRFKQEFKKHKEYLLAPVTRREDGQLWVDVELGIIKSTIHFRALAEIKPDDIDALAIKLPELIVPP